MKKLRERLLLGLSASGFCQRDSLCRTSFFPNTVMRSGSSTPFSCPVSILLRRGMVSRGLRLVPCMLALMACLIA